MVAGHGEILIETSLKQLKTEYRGKQTTKEDDLGLMTFNLIPEGYSYETS